MNKKTNANNLLKQKKGQAAMEYIHTYGWILLSIMAIGGLTLYYFIDNIGNQIPLTCSMFAGISCLDINIEETELRLVLLNEQTFIMSNVTLEIKGTCNSVANTTDGNPYNNPNTLTKNQQAIYFFECQNLTNLELEEKINLTFINSETGEQHFKVGKARYKPGK